MIQIRSVWYTSYHEFHKFDTKGAIRSHKSKNGQYNGQKKDIQNTTQKTIKPTKYWRDLVRSDLYLYLIKRQLFYICIRRWLFDLFLNNLKFYLNKTLGGLKIISMIKLKKKITENISLSPINTLSPTQKNLLFLRMKCENSHLQVSWLLQFIIAYLYSSDIFD
jgi:hypothetical protein